MYKKNVGLYSWVAWGLAASFFFIQYFPRVMPSIIVPQLMQDFQVDAFQLGRLSSFYLVAYVGMQIPVGMLVDRFSVKRLLLMAVMITAIGCFIFSRAENLYLAEFGRFLTGFGGAFGFVSAMKLANVWFPARYFGLLAGSTQALGMFGAALGEGPVSFFERIVGWRSLMLGFSAALCVLALLIFMVLRDRKTSLFHENPVKRTKSDLGFWQSFSLVLKNPQSWLNAGYLACIYAPTMEFAELWGVTFLERAYGLSEAMAAMAISCIFWGLALGAPLVGSLSDRLQRRKPLMLLSGIVSLMTLSLVIYVNNLPTPMLFVLLFIYGVGNTGVIVAYALSGEINSRKIVGTSVAFANMASIIVGTVLEPVIGWLLVLFWDHQTVKGIPIYSVSDFHQALLSLPICLGLSIMFAARVKESYCKPASE